MVTFPQLADPPAGEPGSTRHFCPLDDCGWFHDVAPPNVDETALASVFGLGVMASAAHHLHLQRTEDELRAHLETHTLVEWAKTVGRLQQENQQLQADLEREVAERLQPMPGTIVGHTISGRRIEVPVPDGTIDHPFVDEGPRPRYAPEPETPRYSADLPTGVVGRKT